jgi:hypothetical protein
MREIGVTLLGPAERHYARVEGTKLEEAGKVPSGAGFITVVRARYPGRSIIVTLSDVGFSLDSKRASVRVTADKGNGTGRESVLLLENSAEGWKVIRHRVFFER